MWVFCEGRAFAGDTPRGVSDYFVELIKLRIENHNFLLSDDEAKDSALSLMNP